ncbi:hypothetical protein AAE02nite_01870 [Adhaeribacter aerolatus]|uniref:Uncharacterized protein n=1 Tax=Adhaeribacter aerolatus TaxID=670289 RepID=A0A512AS36_9BACT|nr:hypothetical protein AAE02nite_01870 [Adhaeribacter aerolatus]
MVQTVREILNAKTPLIHFLLILVLSFLLCSSLYILIIPIFYWFSFGEGESAARIASLPLNTFILNWAALIVVLIITFGRLKTNVKRDNLSKAKSYLLTGIIITGLYFFRLVIGESLINLFQ